jgi:4-aminobutyrate aminotransferase/(S)-3-amino-2-methylpropionate transaminase
VATAAAIAAIDMTVEQDLSGRARRIGEIMLPRLHALAAANPCVGDVRGRGAMLAIELIRPDTGWSGPNESGPRWPGGGQPDPELTSAVNDYCHRHGVLTLTAGTYGNVLRFLPPLVMPEHLLVEALDILDEAFAHMDPDPTG